MTRTVSGWPNRRVLMSGTAKFSAANGVVFGHGR
jgi:hypothetical protein